MSHGPCGLCAGALGPAPACAPSGNVAPINMSGSASINARFNLVFIFVLFTLPSEMPGKRLLGNAKLSPLGLSRTSALLGCQVDVHVVVRLLRPRCMAERYA